MQRELRQLRTPEQALADLIKKRDELSPTSGERARVERMIRDLEAEVGKRRRRISPI